MSTTSSLNLETSLLSSLAKPNRKINQEKKRVRFNDQNNFGLESIKENSPVIHEEGHISDDDTSFKIASKCVNEDFEKFISTTQINSENKYNFHCLNGSSPNLDHSNPDQKSLRRSYSSSDVAKITGNPMFITACEEQKNEMSSSIEPNNSYNHLQLPGTESNLILKSTYDKCGIQ